MCTSGFLGRSSTVESHEDGGEGHVALHAVLPNAVQDGHGEVDMEVAQEHDAVVVLGHGGRGGGKYMHAQ